MPPLASSTRTSMPGSAAPSVVVVASSGSSGRVVVTAPFSDMPHAEMIAAPSVARALVTSARGIGAPADTKIFRLGVALPELATNSVRSLRKGVAPMVKVAPSPVIWRAISAAVNTSWSTAVAPSITGRTSPYMKPSWWAIGEGMWMIASPPRCSRSAKGPRLESMVLDVCITPLGSPVVPDV